ncbi:glutamate synthase large subunit [Pseudochryseolinea flava]|uniref:Glutamate synthase [NADPH] large chain n=1 Tax=Pseudochryseolinea flava TaxID=2059302 RepID=A0A364Y7R0_9BACT|nr:glutamate synthase large subunit [Pseudochryseolinea flava]RAW03017.1 glutamate synthase large subunit [Pseudochryseolinea flava]
MKEITSRGLYTPELEHDACGIGFVANINGSKTNQTLRDALSMLENMEHRGGRGSSPKTGDGAGVLLQIPHDFFVEEATRLGFEIPALGSYGVGMVFFPRDKKVMNACREVLRKNIKELGLEVLGFRVVPVDHSIPGPGAAEVEPVIEQVFVKPVDASLTGDAFERRLFVLRNFTSHTISSTVKGTNNEFYITSFSARTIIYKGQLRTEQLRAYFDDLQDARMKTALALVHSRFSTNTFPNWKLAQPFRYIAHNGEINTIRGNVNKMKSKEALFKSTLFTDEEIKRLTPITSPDGSDSANLDALVEMLVLSGRSIPHVMMMLVPEAWQDNKLMDPHRKAFYKYHASMMEPWDGPAALVFTDGSRIGATLDRNGLRPLRYCVTRSGRVIAGSEAGALPVDPKDILEKGRITPGKMLMIDLEQGKILDDEKVKRSVYEGKSYYNWIIQNRLKLRLEPEVEWIETSFDEKSLVQRQNAFGYTSEDVKVLLLPLAEKGYEAIGSMGDDSPQAILSKESRHLSNYFKQLFAQVSNPPIDPIRERLVMSLFTRVGASLNVLEETPQHTNQIHISQPVLLNQDLEKLKHLQDQGFEAAVIQCVFKADGAPGRLEENIDRICAEAEKAVRAGKKIIILSDKKISDEYAPIPTLLAVGAVHQYLVSKRIRTQAGLVVEAGDVWEVHHFATIIGYGASAINPYLALETIHFMNKHGMFYKPLDDEEAFANYQKGIGNGLLKVMSKMGISTLQSYQSAQIFEALGIGSDVMEKCFKGTISRIEGLSFDDIATEVLVRHQLAFEAESKELQVGGIYSWKRRGEKHMFSPETIHLLQHSTKTNNYELYKKYTQKINDQTKDQITIRGLFEFKKRNPIPIAEVEPAEEIFKRFATGAMSFGSISHEAHATLAIAMNRIGGKSNSGEGGEDEIRFEKKENGDWERSAIKQVASGRFGVTSYYLSNADELQIKMAQGAKPGEGGQLPGHKVDEWIGKVRHSTPGVGLISPPPHHDIYSIEDLAQLIFDLKNANRQARINVKLVSQAGVGTVAAGVAKAKADAILISGADGGTGASPISSIRHAGLPWELGLAEAHQTLVKNNLRSRVVLQTDGQIRSGRDIAIAAMLGAEEWGVATAALVVEGCIMMRKCHLNTCPVGIATQDESLRKLFTGDPDHVVNFFGFLAQDLREIMAELGFRTVTEMVGRTDLLRVRQDIEHWKIKKLDLSPILHKEEGREGVGMFKQIEQDFELEKVLDWKLVEAARPALDDCEPVQEKFIIRNTDRSVGALLSNEISKKYKGKGLPEDTIKFHFKGSAGQSFAAFVAPGVTFELEGEANDYFGKGLSGGKLVIYPDKEASFKPEDNMIIGNVAFYGATSGEAFIRGQAGERFCVRNSGVTAVVEGVGDHACEYMTGGRVVVLGKTGKNFAAGMSGGIAYVFDPEHALERLCNREMVDLETMEDEDKAEVRAMIEKHFKYTGSDPAEWVLENWETAVDLFVKVMPRDYKAVLQKLKASRNGASTKAEAPVAKGKKVEVK